VTYDAVGMCSLVSTVKEWRPNQNVCFEDKVIGIKVTAPGSLLGFRLREDVAGNNFFCDIQ
jgi:hypothetical protein